MVCWLEEPINSGLLSWLGGKKLLKQQQSYHLWTLGRRDGKEFAEAQSGIIPLVLHSILL